MPLHFLKQVEFQCSYFGEVGAAFRLHGLMPVYLLHKKINVRWSTTLAVTWTHKHSLLQTHTNTCNLYPYTSLDVGECFSML